MLILMSSAGEAFALFGLLVKRRVFGGVMVWFLYIVPKRLLSKIVGCLARIESPVFLVSLARGWFARRYKLDLSEAEFPIEAYRSLNQLFTRKLKPGLRPLGETEPLHPADAVISQGGEIKPDGLTQIKGRHYGFQDFLGREEVDSCFLGGSFLTYYLCPTDYHRVHSPVSGKILTCEHHGATLWPVNEKSVEKIDQLFIKNERTVTRIETPKGIVAVVMVGATNVGEMSMSFDPEIVTNRRPKLRKSYSSPIEVKAGDELGVFHMGSTVIVLFPKDYFSDSLFEKWVGKVSRVAGSL